LENSPYIQVLINGMTCEERSRLTSLPFDTLWENLWFSQITRQFRNEYESAKRTFEKLRDTGDVYGKLLTSFMESAATQWTEPEWGFPKGRRMPHEPEQACAIREFAEETGIPKEALQLQPFAPLDEVYTGTNGIPYRQVYFIAECAPHTEATHQPNNKVMSREVGNIGWFCYEEAFALIRPTNPEKRAVLTRLHKAYN